MHVCILLFVFHIPAVMSVMLHRLASYAIYKIDTPIL